MLLAAVGDESEESSPESDFREDYVWVKAWKSQTGKLLAIIDRATEIQWEKGNLF